ncbi:MAG: ABC transporter permease subunit [Clostridium sp.]|uniref:ABC transporter permease subunit n=1 Tax=Clostridium sp. TaxID=1506 RepID=UPI003F33B22D
MGALIKNEFIKFFKKPKTRILIILFALTAIGFTFLLYMNGERAKLKDKPDYMIKICKEDISFAKEELRNVENEIAEASESDEVRKLKERADHIKDEIRTYKNNLKYWEKEKINPTPWQEHTKKELEKGNWELTDLKKQRAILKENTILSKERKKEELKLLNESISRKEETVVLLQHSLEKNVKPLNVQRFEPASIMINYSYTLAFLIPLFIALFGSDIVSDEGTNETFKFLLIQPVSRMKILMSKFILLVTTLILLIIGTQLIIYVIAGMINGFDSLNLLAKVGVEYEYDKLYMQEYGIKRIMEVMGSGYYITMKELMVQVFLLQGLFIIASTSLVFLITTVCKSSIISMSIATIVLFGGTILPNFVRGLGYLSHMTFLGYNNPLAVIEGNSGGLYDNIMLKPEHGIVLMVVSTAVFLTLANINFKRKDILG